MQTGFTILDHPSDIGIKARGATLAEAFRQATIGLMSIILDLDSVEVREHRSIKVIASDAEQLLVKWLSEILYFYDGQQFITRDVTINNFTPTRLDATVGGEPLSAEKHRTKLDVKAVTYHQLVVQQNEEGGLIRVFFDI